MIWIKELHTLTFLISVHVRLFILTWISKLFTLIRELYVYFSGEHFWADRLFWISSTFWMSNYVNFIHFEDLKRYVKTINPWCTIIWNVAKLYDYLLVHISPSCTIIQGCTLIRNVRVGVFVSTPVYTRRTIQRCLIKLAFDKTYERSLFLEKWLIWGRFGGKNPALCKLEALHKKNK